MNKDIGRMLFTSVLFLLVETAIAGGGIDSGNVIGKWTGSGTNSRGDVATTSFELKKDATFNGAVEMNHQPYMSYSGTWVLTGNQLVWTYTKNSVPLPESAKVDTDEVSSVDKNHLILISKLSGEKRIYNRMR